jgi:hypothetical protein
VGNRHRRPFSRLSRHFGFGRVSDGFSARFGSQREEQQMGPEKANSTAGVQAGPGPPSRLRAPPGGLGENRRRAGGTPAAQTLGAATNCPIFSNRERSSDALKAADFLGLARNSAPKWLLIGQSRTPAT